MKNILTFIQENWQWLSLVLAIVYEFTAKYIPTFKDPSITGLLKRLSDLIMQNKLKTRF